MGKTQSTSERLTEDQLASLQTIYDAATKCHAVTHEFVSETFQIFIQALPPILAEIREHRNG